MLSRARLLCFLRCPPTSFRCYQVATALYLLAPSAAYSQQQVVVEIPREPVVSLSDAAGISNKLAPALQAAARVNGTFVGMTENGNAVIEFPRGVTASTAKNQLAEAALMAAEPSSEGEPIKIPVRHLAIVTRTPVDSDAAEFEGFRITNRYDAGNLIVIESPDGFSSEEIIRAAAGDNVTYVEPDYPASLDELNTLPDDPALASGLLWGLENIGANNVWQRSSSAASGGELIVAVLDSGVDYTHPDLAKNIWTNTEEVPDNNKDDDNNGCVDDVHGCDFTDETDHDPIDERGHGTHVSGIIDAVGGNGIGILGVAWPMNVRIMPLQIFTKEGDFAGVAQLGKALEYAAANGATIFNMSWRMLNYQVAMNDLFNMLEKRGVLVVAAASNEGTNNDDRPCYPASFNNDNIISVMSIDSDESPSAFSNFGQTSVDIAAPGGFYRVEGGASAEPRSIWSTLPVARGMYGDKYGTSMAAPFVSGAAALVWSQPEYRSRNASVIKRVLLDSARPVIHLQGKNRAGGTLDVSFLASDDALLAERIEEGLTITVIGTLAYPVSKPGGGPALAAVQSDGGLFVLDPKDVEIPEDTLAKLNGSRVRLTGVTKDIDFAGFPAQQMIRVNERAE